MKKYKYTNTQIYKCTNIQIYIYMVYIFSGNTWYASEAGAQWSSLAPCQGGRGHAQVSFRYQYQYPTISISIPPSILTPIFCRRKEGRGNLLVTQCLVEDTPVLPRKVSVPGNYPGSDDNNGDDDDDDDEHQQ